MVGRSVVVAAVVVVVVAPSGLVAVAVVFEPLDRLSFALSGTVLTVGPCAPACCPSSSSSPDLWLTSLWMELAAPSA